MKRKKIEDWSEAELRTFLKYGWEPKSPMLKRQMRKLDWIDYFNDPDVPSSSKWTLGIFSLVVFLALVVPLLWWWLTL